MPGTKQQNRPPVWFLSIILIKSRIFEDIQLTEGQFVKKFLMNSLKAVLLKRKKIIVSEMIGMGRERRIPLEFLSEIDYIRTSTLELAANEIYASGVEGATAELGVFRGDFAQYINQLFPDRKLYLFDTFTGFDERDLEEEHVRGYNATRNERFATQGSIDSVMSKMKYPDNCIARIGYFPETSAGLEDERYCFVSIDVDLYQPIYQGLTYFYPRLSKGGFIFIHDYHKVIFKGCKEAVKQFCAENNIGFVPLTDRGGTVVITK